jgi:hypothetical protein
MLMRNLAFVAFCVLALGITSQRLLPRQLAMPQVDSVWPGYASPDFEAMIAAVNQDFANAWQSAGQSPAPPADEWTVYRRVALALVGTIPSLEEIRQLEQVEADQRLAWWVDHLLADRRSSDYLAERFARAFVGTEEGPFLVFRRRRFVAWLSDQFAANRPYDQLVRDLISDTGLWTDSPAVNFLTVTNDDNGEGQPAPEPLAGRTARAFLGIRLDCVQCHDDHLRGEWRQQDFQQLAAFYAGANSSLLGIRDKSAEYEFQYLHADEKEVVPPKTPFQPELLPDDGTRREQLAGWVTDPANQAFSRAIVNRIWALLVGRPLVEPVDDIPLTGPYPPGIELLAKDFTDHDFDLRRLIRAIVQTQVFQLSSRAPDGVSSAQEQAWAAFPLTRLRPEQVAGSLIQASVLTTIDSNSHILVRLARSDQQANFVRRFGDTGEDEFTDRGGTIPQRLLLMNGQLVRERTKEDLVANAVTRINALTSDDRRAVEVAYWTTLTRRPSAEELTYFVERLQAENGSQRKSALEDLFWALFNATEFSWSH